MKRLTILAVAIAALAVPAVASAHYTYVTHRYDSNVITDTGASPPVVTLQCGDTVGVGGSDPAIRYVREPADDELVVRVSHGVGPLHYEAPSLVSENISAGTVNYSDGNPTGEMGSRDNVWVYPFGVQMHTVKFNAFSGTWLVQRICP